MRLPLALVALLVAGCGDVTNITNVIVVADSATADSEVAIADTARVEDAATDSDAARVDVGGDSGSDAAPRACGDAACSASRICVQTPETPEGTCGCTAVPKTACETRSGVERTVAWDCPSDHVPVEFDCAKTDLGVWCCP